MDVDSPDAFRPPGFVRLDVRPERWGSVRTGRPTTEKELERLGQLRLPPAWRHVWASDDASAALQATGVDARGRTQYRYSAAATAAGSHRKFQQMIAFAETLPLLRDVVARDLGEQGPLSARHVAALVVRLLDQSLLRVGNERYARDNRTYGLTTLLSKNVTAHSQGVTFAFIGKEHIPHRVDISDRIAAQAVRRLVHIHNNPEHPVFSASATGKPIASSSVNAYLHAHSGVAGSAKMFRTWGATAIAVTAVAVEAESRGLPVQRAIRAAAAALGDTPGVTRSSYLHPNWLDAGRVPNVIKAVADASERLDTDAPKSLFLNAAVQAAVLQSLVVAREAD